jgi:uncharacterized coiled-coil DUF342 family protein
VGALVDDGLDHLDSSEDPHETVHEVRKRCKETRATLRLVRELLPTYSDENAHYRDAARRLSYIRDAQVLSETFEEQGERLFVEEPDALVARCEGYWRSTVDFT